MDPANALSVGVASSQIGQECLDDLFLVNGFPDFAHDRHQPFVPSRRHRWPFKGELTDGGCAVIGYTHSPRLGAVPLDNRVRDLNPRPIEIAVVRQGDSGVLKAIQQEACCGARLAFNAYQRLALGPEPLRGRSHNIRVFADVNDRSHTLVRKCGWGAEQLPYRQIGRFSNSCIGCERLTGGRVL